MTLDLTRREVEALSLMARGLTAEEAGAKLGISKNTVFYRLHRARARNGGLTTFALMYQLGLMMGERRLP
ncbi:hypothetical protein LCGC14_0935490 [marine sediment metagenome]|uniref:HTH luxR-type domain-containing protein n=1 Tax=marine sediment metagenome TaxID=412755 RepID=A0A0F9RT65_9ZZZZ